MELPFRFASMNRWHYGFRFCDMGHGVSVVGLSAWYVEKFAKGSFRVSNNFNPASLFTARDPFSAALKIRIV